MVIYKIYNGDYILQAVIEDDWETAYKLIQTMSKGQRPPYVEIHENPSLLSSPKI